MIAVRGIDERDTPDVFFRDLRAGGEGISDPVWSGILAGSGPEVPAYFEISGNLYRRDGEGRSARRSPT
jgi:succinate dehydrogenase/fumarate reductase flavoprotein subunit